MKKFKNAKIIISVICILIFSIPTLAANPGSSDDPLISLSYLNDVVIPQLKGYVDAAVGNGTNGMSKPLGEGVFNSYEVVTVGAGKTIYGAKSCHMILRMGSASVVASQKGGVADVTSGADLLNGATVYPNHLLIVPVDDGRGIKMQTDGIVMVSGKFTVR